MRISQCVNIKLLNFVYDNFYTFKEIYQGNITELIKKHSSFR